MSNIKQPISGSIVQNPYQEFTFTLAPYEIKRINYAFSMWHIASASNTDFVVDFAGLGATSIVGAGIGMEMVEPIPHISFRNTHGTNSVTITVILGMGKIVDTRLTLSGNVGIKPNTIVLTNGDLVIPPLTLTQLAGTALTRKYYEINNLDLVNDVRIGDGTASATRGHRVEALQGYTWESTQALYAYSVLGCTLSRQEVRE